MAQINEQPPLPDQGYSSTPIERFEGVIEQGADKILELVGKVGNPPLEAAEKLGTGVSDAVMGREFSPDSVPITRQMQQAAGDKKEMLYGVETEAKVALWGLERTVPILGWMRRLATQLFGRQKEN